MISFRGTQQVPDMVLMVIRRIPRQVSVQIVDIFLVWSLTEKFLSTLQ